MAGFGWQELVVAIVLIFVLVCYVAIGLWMRTDAEERGMRGAPWYWAWLFCNVTALIIYVMVRPRRIPRSE